MGSEPDEGPVPAFEVGVGTRLVPPLGRAERVVPPCLPRWLPSPLGTRRGGGGHGDGNGDPGWGATL